MIKRVLVGFGMALACAAVGGCKSSSDASPVAADQLPAALAATICDSLAGCCSSAKLTFDSTNCRGGETADFKARIDSKLLPAVRYDAQAAGDCVAQLKNSIRCGDIDAADGIESCDRIFVGTLAIGQACTESAECKEPGYCPSNQFTPPGETPVQPVCTASTSGTTSIVRGKAGDTCIASCQDEASCQQAPFPGPIVGDPAQPAPSLVACYRSDGLYCQGTCTKLGALGEPCGSFDSCQEGLFCDSGAVRCTAPHPNGATCNGNYECQSNVCTGGTCSTTSVTAAQCATGTP